MIRQRKLPKKTKKAINQFYFAVPDFRGAFIRGWDKDMQIYLGYRYFPYGQGLIRNHLGSFQLDEIYAHSHRVYVEDLISPPGILGVQNYDRGKASVLSTDVTGGEESRPANFAANFVSKI